MEFSWFVGKTCITPKQSWKVYDQTLEIFGNSSAALRTWQRKNWEKQHPTIELTKKVIKILENNGKIKWNICCLHACNIGWLSRLKNRIGPFPHIGIRIWGLLCRSYNCDKNHSLFAFCFNTPNDIRHFFVCFYLIICVRRTKY